MNKSRQTSCKTLALVLCLISIGWAHGQKETKTYNEAFTVSKDAVLTIDTSHADIEFETWGKDEVAVAAIIEIEGTSAEEAERYFQEERFEILGNSQKVEISTKAGSKWFSSNEISHIRDFDFEVPEVPYINGIDMAFDIIASPELAELPELPRGLLPNFDYHEFRENGEEYMEKWKEEFDESFGEEYQKKMEDWGKRLEERQRERLERQEEHLKRMEERAEERAQQRQEIAEERVRRLEEAQRRREERVNDRVRRERNVFISREDSDGPNIFYFNSDGENKNYKVKKTIKIKMPKGMKIKMNVRHGEVKLADNVWHMNADLSHSTLWASGIDGDKTTIKASYSPIRVDHWYLGNLQANYSEQVDLKEVIDIKLNTTSSNVTIDKLVKNAYVKNNFGQLKISSITNDFDDLDITLQNAELDFVVPDVAFDIYVNGTSSTFKSPSSMNLERTKNHNSTIHKGYHMNSKGGKSIVINSKYSDVTLH